MDLAELVARESVRDLVARYNANGDSGRYPQLLELFAPDAVMELNGVTYRGHEELRGMFTGAAATFAGRTGFQHVRHFTSTLQIDVALPEQVRSRCYFAVLMAEGLDHWGRYVDRFRQLDGRWLFAERKVTVDGRAT